MNSAVSAKGTRPGYFIEISNGVTTFRWCTRSSTPWNGHSWAAHPVSVSGAGVGGNGVVSPTLSVKDMTGATIASALAGDFKDAAVHIWVMDAGATGASDPVLVFSGAVNSIQCDVPEMSLTITLAVARASALFSPRLTYSPANGFNSMVPRGTIIAIGNKEYKVERR